MIEIIMSENKEKTLTFEDVLENYFFKDEGGYLCQKSSSDEYNIVATPEGKPYAVCIDNVDSHLPVLKIYDVALIKFD